MSSLLNKLKRNVVIFIPPAVFLLNVLCFVLGIVYLLGAEDRLFVNLYGLLMLLVFLCNTSMAYYEEIQKPLGYGYLLLSFFVMLILPIMNTVVSVTPSNHSSRSMVSILGILILFLYGAFLALHRIINKQNRQPILNIYEIPEHASQNPRKNVGILVLAVIFSILLLSGLPLITLLLRERKNGYIEVIISEYALFYGLVFLNLGVFLHKLSVIKRHDIYRSILLTATISIVLVCLLPLLYTPGLLKSATESYQNSFGVDVQKENDDQSRFFRQAPFSLTEYFYGTKSKDYLVREDILFYSGTKGVDEGLKLYYDVYTPPADSVALPGGRSVLIRLHGGGWNIGDKGEFNFAQMNKYFAAQGYVVFDVQYGLNNQEKIIDFVPVEKTRLGAFTMDDMVRHIGIFMDYLIKHEEEYRVNLDSIFLSGGSAGGQLTLAAGLALDGQKHHDIFPSNIKVKGLIPFYPANGLAGYVGIAGSEELIDPSALVRKTSPPCLIYQGSHDGVVDPFIAARFQKAYYKAGNEKCAIITMPFGGHGSDLYFSGYYNQIFLYYMERFLYQYR